MTQPFILTASQAAELHATGRLTGYREKCEVEADEIVEVYKALSGNWCVRSNYKGCPCLQSLTPPRDTDTAYAVKEPAMVDLVKTSNQDDSTEGADWIGAFVVYGEPPKDYRQHGEWHDCPAEYADAWNRDVELGNHDELLVYSAETMPDWAIRQHVRITDRKLAILDDELWWDMDLEKVAK